MVVVDVGFGFEAELLTLTLLSEARYHGQKESRANRVCNSSNDDNNAAAGDAEKTSANLRLEHAIL